MDLFFLVVVVLVGIGDDDVPVEKVETVPGSAGKLLGDGIKGVGIFKGLEELFVPVELPYPIRSEAEC